MGGSRPEYRPDIDGLRAVAILSVVAYHAGIPFAVGGFTGVDVFFVISGFLITGILLREQTLAGRIDLPGFYARRVRRLVPALAVVLLATLALGLVLLKPIGEQQKLGESAAAAALFVSNLWAWRSQTGYFAEIADLQPLLHTWSLAVEEQFYLGFPLLLLFGAWLARRTGRQGAARDRLMQALIVIAMAASFVAWLIISRLRDMAGFYLSPGRAWEFAIGAFLAAAPAPALLVRRPKLAGALALTGLALIVGAVLLLPLRRLFGGLFALPPTLGAAGVILGCGLAPRGWSARLLSSAPFVWIGRLSYSWYLWHWPLLAFVRATTLERNLLRDLLLCVVALGLSALTFWLVEQPIRQRRPFPFASRRGALTTGAVLLLSLAGTGFGLRAMADGAQHATPRFALIAASRQDGWKSPRSCTEFRSPNPVLQPADKCAFGQADAPAVLLYGDSHAQQLLPALEAVAAEAGVRVIVRTSSGCKPYQAPPSPLAPGAVLDCAAFNREVLAEIPRLAAQHRLAGVIVAARWMPSSAWSGDLVTALGRIHAAGVRVVAVKDNPRLPHDPGGCLARYPGSSCGLSRTEAQRYRDQSGVELSKAVAIAPWIETFDPIPYLCTSVDCPAAFDAGPLYRDYNHLSRSGALRLSAPLKTLLEDLAQPLRQNSPSRAT